MKNNNTSRLIDLVQSCMLSKCTHTYALAKKIIMHVTNIHFCIL